MPYSCGCEMCRTSGAEMTCDYCGSQGCDGECRSCPACGSFWCAGGCQECSECGRDNEDCACSDDYDDYSGSHSGRNGLMPYSYSPELVFHGADTEPNKTFYGMEFEVSASYGSVLRDSIETANNALGPLGYLKEDGSVDGFEMCLQPMSYDWAMANMPWSMLPALDRDGCEIDPSTNGIHVHVSRDGFSSPAHLYRWMKFWYRNERDISRIARRRGTSWARYEPSHRKAHLTHCKKLGKNYDPYDRRSRYDDNYDATLDSRYSAINTTNAATLEVRVFASTLDATEAQACLALVAASVEYTRQLRSHDVVKNDGWSWNAFRQYFTSAGKYAALVTIDGTL